MARPYLTHYFHSPTDLAAAYTSQGHPVTEEGAIRAAIVRVFLGEYSMAIVYRRRDMVPLYNIRREQSGRARSIRVGYGSGIPFRAGS